MTRHLPFEDRVDEWDEGSWRRVYANQHVNPDIESGGGFDGSDQD